MADAAQQQQPPPQAVVRAARAVADDILIAYYEDEERRAIVQVLLDAMPTQRAPRDGLTLLQMRDRLAMAAPERPPPTFAALDEHLRAFVAHRWVSAWVDPTTQVEYFGVPIRGVVDAFRESAAAEVAVYEQRCAPDSGGILFQCRVCGATRPLLDVLGMQQRVTLASSGATGLMAPSYCTTCTQTGTIVQLGAVAPEDHARVRHVLRPLLHDLDALEAACLAADAAAAAARATRRPRAPPTLVRACLRRVRGSGGGTMAVRHELNCDVYIGADQSVRDPRLTATRWAPPPCVGGAGGRHAGAGLTAREVEAYVAEIRTTPALRAALLTELGGKRLGCSCRYSTVAAQRARAGGGGSEGGGDGGTGSILSGRAVTAATRFACHGEVLIALFNEMAAAAAAAAAE